jgi:hypothetical protein
LPLKNTRTGHLLSIRELKNPQSVKPVKKEKENPMNGDLRQICRAESKQCLRRTLYVQLLNFDLPVVHPLRYCLSGQEICALPYLFRIPQSWENGTETLPVYPCVRVHKYVEE